MIAYIVRRFAYMIVIMVAVSVVAFVIIQLPPGDYLTTVIESMRTPIPIIVIGTAGTAALIRVNAPVHWLYHQCCWVRHLTYLAGFSPLDG